MSREFGSYSPGYFDAQVENHADDLKHGRDALTRIWAEFFAAFMPVASSICASEAGDSGQDDAIMETIKQMPAIKEAIKNVETYIRPFEGVARAAVRAHIKNPK